jgi:hypothetical protein
LDYDFKRKPIDTHDDKALLTAQTIPWDTVADFEKARDDLEAWKHSQRRVLKTRSDYDAMISWAENVSARRAAGVKSGNSLGPLTAAFLRIAICRAYTSSGWFHEIVVPRAETMLFPKGKTQFLRPDHTIGKEPGHGVVLLGMGEVANRALERSGLGWFLVNPAWRQQPGAIV